MTSASLYHIWKHTWRFSHKEKMYFTCLDFSTIQYVYRSFVELNLRRKMESQKGLYIINGMCFIKFNCSVCVPPRNGVMKPKLEN